MTTLCLPHVLYDLGTTSLKLIEALVAAGRTVVVVEPNPHDAARMGDIVQRRMRGAHVTVGTVIPDSCAGFVCRGCDVTYAPRKTLIVVVDGPEILGDGSRSLETVAMDVSHTSMVEVAFGAASQATRSAAIDLIGLLGCACSVSQRTDVFEGTILQDAVLAMIDRLTLVGCLPWELDEALEQTGFAPGILKAQDDVGLEVAFGRRQARGHHLLVADRMVREGRLGRSVGVGWYRYPGGGGAVVDPLIEDLIVEEARFAGIRAVPMTPAQAAEAVLLGMINAAAKLVSENMTRENLDRLALHKIGLANMHQRAAEVSLSVLRTKLGTLARIDADLWGPADNLTRLLKTSP